MFKGTIIPWLCAIVGMEYCQLWRQTRGGVIGHVSIEVPFSAQIRTISSANRYRAHISDTTRFEKIRGTPVRSEFSLQTNGQKPYFFDLAFRLRFSKIRLIIAFSYLLLFAADCFQSPSLDGFLVVANSKIIVMSGVSTMMSGVLWSYPSSNSGKCRHSGVSVSLENRAKAKSCGNLLSPLSGMVNERKPAILSAIFHWMCGGSMFSVTVLAAWSTNTFSLDMYGIERGKPSWMTVRAGEMSSSSLLMEALKAASVCFIS